MPVHDLETWAAQLEAGKTGEPTLDLAARLASQPAPNLRLPAKDRARLRSRLLQHYAPIFPMWIRLAPAGLLTMIAILVIAGLGALTIVNTLPGMAEKKVSANPENGGASLPILGKLVFLYTPPDASSGDYEQYPAQVAIFQANVDGSSLTQVTPFFASRLSLHIEGVSPDDKWIYYSRYPKENLPGGIGGRYKQLYRIRLDGNQETLITNSYLPGSLHWLEDSGVVFVTRVDNRPGIAWIDAVSIDLKVIAKAQGDPVGIIQANRESGVVWGEVTGQSNMYMNPVSSNIDLLQYWRTSLDGASQPVFSDIANRIASVILSPDGKQFSYMRTDCPSKEGYAVSCPSVFLSDLHDRKTSEIPLPGLLGIYDRSPDGAWLLLNSQEGKRSAMYLWSPVSGAKERLPDELQNQSNSGLPKWSPDGKYLLFENMSWAAPRILDIKKQQVMEALVRLKAKELNWYYTWDATWLPMNN